MNDSPDRPKEVAESWLEAMHRRGLVNENGWFVHRLWKIPPVFAPKADLEAGGSE